MGYVKLGSPPAIGNVIQNTGQFSTVGVGAAAATSALYVNATNRIGAWITGSNVSTGADADGLFIDASFAPSANVGNAASIGLFPTFNPPGGITITTGYGLYVAAGTQGGAGAVTTGYGLFVTHPAFGTTNYAAQIDNIRIDVNSITATNVNGTMTVVSDGTGACNLGTNATAHTTTVGSTTTTATTAIQSGSGGITVATSSNGTIGINSGTGTISVSTDASATTVNIATGGAVKTATFGSTNTTSTTTIQSGSGALNITSTNGAQTHNSGTGTINISSDATNTTVNLGTGAGAKVVTVGSTNGASSLALKTGTADFSLASATGTIMSALDTGEITYPLQPAFFAWLSTGPTNVTGDGTAYTIIYDTEVFDQNSDFNLATSVFTAPVTGKYQFCGQLSYGVDTSAPTSGSYTLTTSNLTIRFCRMANTAESAAPSSKSGAILCDMDAADTASTVLTLSGSTKAVDMQGATAGAPNNSFSGYLAC